MVVIVQPDTPAPLRQEYVDVAIGGVTVQLALDVVAQTLVAVAKRHRLCAEVMQKARRSSPPYSFLNRRTIWE